jgi:PEP-CTERM motif-containing protein
MWNGLTWGAGHTFDLQVAGFTNGTGVFETPPAVSPVATPSVSVPEPGALALLSTGLLGFAVFVRRKFAA